MLTFLKVKNFAIIDELEIEFSEGFNILTGETGAGKSILLKALSLLMGERSSQEYLRAGAKEAEVQAIFQIDSVLLEKLKLLDLEIDTEVVIRRVINENNQNKIFINGNVVSLNTLKEVSKNLMDLCGQHHNQTLMIKEEQLKIVDTFSSKDLIFKIKELVREIRIIDKKLEELDVDPEFRKQRMDYLKYQIDEIKSLDPKEEEEQELLDKENKLKGFKDLSELVQKANGIIYNEELSIVSSLEELIRLVKFNLKFDSSLQEINEKLTLALSNIEESGDFFHRYGKQMKLDDEEINKIVDRLEEIKRLKKKFGGDIKSVLNKLQDLNKEYDTLNNLDENKKSLEYEKNLLIKKYKKEAEELHKQRTKAAQEISKKVTKELQDLKMSGSQFLIEVLKTEKIQEEGIDEVNFLISPNKGENLKPLEKVASGGELSRVMLAVHRVLTEKTSIPVYLFDEVDAGIGGETGKVVGEKLKEIGRKHQIICISHLPQVAVFANNHLIIEKQEIKGRTVSQVKTLNSQEDKIQEVARMLSGSMAFKKNLESAKAMFEEVLKNK